MSSGKVYPLKSLVPLLRISQYGGSCAANFKKDGMGFEIGSRFRYASLVIMSAMCHLSFVTMGYFGMTAAEVEANNITSITDQMVFLYSTIHKLTNSTLDSIAMTSFSTVYTLYIIFVVSSNHAAVGKYDAISRLIGEVAEQDQASQRGLLLYYGLITLNTLIRTMAITAMQVEVLGLHPAFMFYFLAVVFMINYLSLENAPVWPSVIFMRFVHCVTNKIRILNNSKDDDEEFVDGIAESLDAIRNLEKAFNYVNFFSISLSMMFNILGIYMTFSQMVSHANVPIMCVPYMLLSAVPLTTFLYFTTGIQRLREQVEAASDNLGQINKNDKVPKRLRAEAVHLQRRLDRFDGFSCCGFFTINRPLLTAVSGQLLTYIMILIEFKLNGN